MNSQHSAGELVAVDWGTSSFRLSLLDGAGRLLEQRVSGRGVGQMRQEELLPFLHGEIAKLPGRARALPVILCGMAGSNIGLQNVPYHPCPVDPQQLAASLAPLEEADLNAHIIPGLSTRTAGGELEVMRGEETQIVGWLAQASEEERQSSWLCLPGTHAKWVNIEKGEVQQFSTAITGELYALLNKHSVLVQGEQKFSRQAFDSGVAASDENPDLAFNLFSTRTRVLDQRLPPSEAAAYLSGLLIGSEIRARFELESGAPGEDWTVHLIGDRHITELYQRALTRRDIGSRQYEGADLALSGLWQLYQQSGKYD